jgi:hypothetical protein
MTIDSCVWFPSLQTSFNSNLLRCATDHSKNLTECAAWLRSRQTHKADQWGRPFGTIIPLLPLLPPRPHMVNVSARNCHLPTSRQLMYCILCCIEGSTFPVVTGFEVLLHNSPSNFDYHFLSYMISRLLCFVYIDHLSLCLRTM